MLTSLWWALCEPHAAWRCRVDVMLPRDVTIVTIVWCHTATRATNTCMGPCNRVAGHAYGVSGFFRKEQNPQWVPLASVGLGWNPLNPTLKLSRVKFQLQLFRLVPGPLTLVYILMVKYQGLKHSCTILRPKSSRPRLVVVGLCEGLRYQHIVYGGGGGGLVGNFNKYLNLYRFY